MKTVITVCARGGSKGVKGKNIKKLNGIPLIVHTLRQAKASHITEYLAVSSDSEEILSFAEAEGFLAVKRPDELASDIAPKLPVIRHCVEIAEKHFGTTFDYCIDLDCTSPLRDIKDIREVFELIKLSATPNVITAMPARRSPYFNQVEVDKSGDVKLVKELKGEVVRRQDAPPCYDMNASIYAWKREVLMKEDKLFLKGTRLYVMPEERSIDIDSDLDFKFVELLMTERDKK